MGSIPGQFFGHCCTLSFKRQVGEKMETNKTFRFHQTVFKKAKSWTYSVIYTVQDNFYKPFVVEKCGGEQKFLFLFLFDYSKEPHKSSIWDRNHKKKIIFEI